ncbi:MAG TPA: hypothetical protein EYQ50_11290 [Verrucomicrobiales bacterium]|nr:hypothetical protein [Verrucomicrobiales bacterium]
MDNAIGLDNAAKIFYRALTVYLQKQSQFIDMRIAAVTSAEDLFGVDSGQAKRTREAFDLVEIFAAPTTPTPQPIPTVEGEDSLVFFRWEPLFEQFVMGRRESGQNDPVEGVIFNTVEFPALKRVSISGDGSVAVFITVNNDVGFIQTLDGAVTFANLPGGVHSIAISPDSSKFAVVLLDAVTGQPTNDLVIVDIVTATEETISLKAPTLDGDQLDIIQFADVLDFFPDGSSLIYDALAEMPIQGAPSFRAWTLYRMDLQSQAVSTLVALDEGLDFGNPNLSYSRWNLITFEVLDRATGIAEVFAADMITGEFNLIFTQSEPNILGVPTYTGDDSAIVFSTVDSSNATNGSLLIQALESDGITPVGNPELYLANGVYGTVYRRGDFKTQNALPQVSITNPVSGTISTFSQEFSIEAEARDPDGSIARVEFYLGSKLLSTDNSAPYLGRVGNVPVGMHRLTARAFDNYGAVADSEVVEISIIVNQPIKLGARFLLTGQGIEINLSGVKPGQLVQIDSSNDLKVWTPVSTLTGTGNELKFTDKLSENILRRFYRVKSGNRNIVIDAGRSER